MGQLLAVGKIIVAVRDDEISVLEGIERQAKAKARAKGRAARRARKKTVRNR